MSDEECPRCLHAQTERPIRPTDPTHEEWRPVPDFPGYEVSSRGRVRVPDKVVAGRSKIGDPTERRYSGRLLSVASGHFNARRDGESHKLKVSRVVLLAFVGPRPDGQEARHWDDDPTHNCLANLLYGTRRENVADQIRNHDLVHANSTSGLTPDDVREIRASTLSNKTLGLKYGVRPYLIWGIRTGRTWKHVV